MAQPGDKRFEDAVNSLYAFLVELHSARKSDLPARAIMIEVFRRELEWKGMPVLPEIAHAIRLLCVRKDNKAELEKARSMLPRAPPAFFMRLGYLLHAAQASVFYSKGSGIVIAEVTRYFNRSGGASKPIVKSQIAAQSAQAPIPQPKHDKMVSEGLAILCRHVTSALKGAEAGDYSAIPAAIAKINSMEPKYASIPFVSLAREMLNSSFGPNDAGHMLVQLDRLAGVFEADKAAALRVVDALKCIRAQVCARIEGFERAVSRLSELAAKAGRAADHGNKGILFSARDEARDMLGRSRPNSPEQLLASALDAALSGMPPEIELESAEMAIARSGFLSTAQRNNARDLIERIRRVRRGMLSFRKAERAALRKEALKREKRRESEYSS